MKALRNAMTALALSVLAAGSFGSSAWAGDHGREHGGGGERGGRGGGLLGAFLGGGRGGFERPEGGRGRIGRGPEGPGRFEGGPPPGAFAPRGYARPDYPGYPPAYGPPGAYPRGGPAGNWRRGQFLPRNYWSGPTLDPRRYRLRSPPPGYVWYGVGRDAYLVQRSTGMILDTAPGAW